jgi:hypothetical protein
MSDESLVEMFKIISQEKEEAHKNLVHEQEKEVQR